jgi:hypothetical protein
MGMMALDLSALLEVLIASVPPIPNRTVPQSGRRRGRLPGRR